MVQKIDIYISKLINQFAFNNKLISIFLTFITHTSSGKIYPFYVIIIPLLLPNDGIQIAKLGLLAFAFQVPMYMISKNIIKRTRPSIKHGVQQIIKPPDKYSFPSGHCASSILFTLIINNYVPELTIYFVIWMVLVFISRIALGLHYLTDAIAGLFLGIISFYITTQIKHLFNL